MVTVQEVSYSNFGRCAVITDGKAELYVTLDVGPRIIRYGFVGKENMMWEDKDRLFFKNGPDFACLFGKNTQWNIYGGHRMWLSPEKWPASYYPDNEPVAYEKTECGIRLLCKTQIANQIRYEIEISLDEETSRAKISHKAINENTFPVEFSIWGLSVTNKNGLLVMPVTQKDTGLLPNRHMALWPYSKLNDSRVYWGEKFITLRQDPAIQQAFKLGLTNEDAYAMLFNHDCLFIKQFDYQPNAVYPDGGMSFETYTNEHFLEVESLGAFVRLAPGESTVHAEYWSLFENVEKPAADDEAAFEAMAKKYL